MHFYFLPFMWNFSKGLPVIYWMNFQPSQVQMSSNRLLLLALLVLLALASLCVEGFIIQELPLYRSERNLEEKAFERALRSRSFGTYQGFHEPYFVSYSSSAIILIPVFQIRNFPSNYGNVHSN